MFPFYQLHLIQHLIATHNLCAFLKPFDAQFHLSMSSINLKNATRIIHVRHIYIFRSGQGFYHWIVQSYYHQNCHV